MPLPYLREGPGSAGKGWFMRLEPKPLGEHYKSYPGVYSTSFAIQLLCRQRTPAADTARGAIVAGTDYLVAQFLDSKRLDAGETPVCKQNQKLQDVGHHDFILTLKLCAVLQAANAIAKIKHTHTDFSSLLDRSSAPLDEIASRVKQMASRGVSGQRAELAWPWHSRSGEVDTIPTCEALLTLTDESGGPNHWLGDYLQAAGYLISVLEVDSASILNKVYACKTLLEVESRLKVTLIPPGLKQSFASELESAMSDLANLPWQEVMHFQVPSSDNRILSHYKPWIWTFPKIEFTQCFSGLSPNGSRRAEFEVAAQLLRNVSRNSGMVIFLQSAPPTLLASLKAADFLADFQQKVLSTTVGKLSFTKERFLLAASGFLSRHRNVHAAVFFLLLMAALTPYRTRVGESLVNAGPVSRSLSMIHDSALQLAPAWPLWFAYIVFLFALNQGTFFARARAAAVAFVGTVIMRVLLTTLPAIR